MTNEELQEQLAGAQFAAAQHLKTVQQQAKIINGMDPRPIPASHRLLPVALHPAIEEALKRHCMMPMTAWQDVIAAADRVNRDAEKAVCQHCGPDGLTASDGSGPYDCYVCGKKAFRPTAERSDKATGEILNLLTEQKVDVKQRDGDWWRGYEAALHWISQAVSEKQNNEAK